MGKEYNRKTIKASGEEYFRVSLPKMFNRIAGTVIEGINYIPGMDELTVSEYVVETKSYLDRKETLEEGDRGETLRIVLVSDLHAHRFGSRQERLGEAVRNLNPEMILFAGDWVRINYEDFDAQSVRDAARVLAEIAPTYSNLGNHEIHAFGRTKMINDLTELGVTFLQNETETLQLGRKKLELTGLTTRYSYYFGHNRKRRQDELKGMLKELKDAMKTGRNGETLDSASTMNTPEDEVLRIVIAHRPELFKLYAKAGMDLVLAGHAHGGLIKLSKNLRLLAPDQGLFPRYFKGLFTKDRTNLIISEGLGGPRLGIKPEIVVINLKY